MHRGFCVLSAISILKGSHKSLPNCLIQKINENCHFLHPFQPSCLVFHGTCHCRRIVQDFREILGVRPSTSHRQKCGVMSGVFSVKSQANWIWVSRYNVRTGLINPLPPAPPRTRRSRRSRRFSICLEVTGLPKIKISTTQDENK